MHAWLFRSSARDRPSRVVRGSVFFCAVLAFSVGAGRGQEPSPLLEQATAAEAAGQLPTAIDRLYTLLLEQPHSPDSLRARLLLARLLVLTGDASAAVLQCQAFRDEPGAAEADRAEALDLATTLARRVRGRPGASPYVSMTVAGGRGLQQLDTPVSIEMEPSGTFLVVDEGDKRIYRIGADGATVVAAALRDPTAAAVMPDGTLVVGTRDGLVTVPGNTPVARTATERGRSREIKRIRSVAVNSRGDLFVVAREVDGLLRCAAGGGPCVVWGSNARLRTVKVGLGDLVYVLADNQQAVQVINEAGRAVLTVGPTVAGARTEKIGDIAVDNAYGLYLLDTDLKRVHVVALKSTGGNAFAVDALGNVPIPTEGDRSLRNPSAIGVTRDGTLLVAGRSAPRLLRFQ
jgi:hypothetical protein